MSVIGLATWLIMTGSLWLSFITMRYNHRNALRNGQPVRLINILKILTLVVAILVSLFTLSLLFGIIP